MLCVPSSCNCVLIVVGSFVGLTVSLNPDPSLQATVYVLTKQNENQTATKICKRKIISINKNIKKKKNTKKG